MSDDLVLVYDKNNKGAGEFALKLFGHSRKWLGFSIQEPKPGERTSFSKDGVLGR